MEELISIIIPVYNVEKYLNRCLESVINQKYRKLEIILIDDGSTDNSGKICDEYALKDSRIKVIHKKNDGVSVARNTGIKIAKGNYIGFVDSDDWIHPDMYKKLYQALIKNQADISCCKEIRCKNGVEKISKKFDNKITEYDQMQYIKKFFKINSQECIYYVWNKLYKRQIIDEEQYPINLISEDVVGTYKALVKSNKIVEINYPYYYYYYNPNSITSKAFSKEDFDLIEIWDKVIEITEKESPNYLWMAELNRNRIDYTLLMRMALQLDFSEIRKLYPEQYKKMLSSLKQNKKSLLNAKIPFSRKITIILICWNYKMFVNLLKIKRIK